MRKPKVTLTVETGPVLPKVAPVRESRPPPTNLPRTIKVADLEVDYRPQDYWDEFKGGTLEPRGRVLPSVYVYAKTDLMRPGIEGITGYEINWGCCGSIALEEFEKWVNLCALAIGMARDLESRLALAKDKKGK